MANEVIINVKTNTTQAVQGVKSFKDGLLSLTRGAQDIKSSFDLASGAVAGIIRTSKDILKTGSQYNQTAQSFQGLIDKIGLAPNLLSKLRDASRGTIDDMQIMSSTTTLLAGASDMLAKSLGNATPELLAIAKAANKLNPALGDTNFLYESITTGIKRGSPMILDNLGLTIKIGEANEKYAKSLGKTVTQLTAEETKVALLNATLEAGNVLMEQAGGNADSMTDSLARLEATTKNLDDELKGRLAPFLANAADAAYLLLTWSDQINSALDEQNRTLIENKVPYKDYLANMIAAEQAAGRIVKVENNKVFVYERGARGLIDVTNKTNILTRSEYALETATYNATSASQMFLQTYGPGALATLNEGASAIENTNRKMDALATSTDRIRGAYNDMNTAQKNLQDATTAFGEKVGGDLQTALEGAGVKGQKMHDALVVIDEVMGTSLDPAMQLEEQTAQLAKDYASGKLTADGFKEALIQQKEPMMALFDAVIKARVQLETLEATLKRLTDRVWRIQVEMGSAPSAPFTPTPITPTDPYGPTGGGSGGGYYNPYGSNSVAGGVSANITINQSPGQSAAAVADAIAVRLGTMANNARNSGRGYQGG